MELITVVSGFYSEPAPSTAMRIKLVVREPHVGNYEDRFCYSPEDSYGLNPDITAWFFEHPEFTPEPYDPNRET